jgi:hypothetical protein
MGEYCVEGSRMLLSSRAFQGACVYRIEVELRRSDLSQVLRELNACHFVAYMTGGGQGTSGTVADVQ